MFIVLTRPGGNLKRCNKINIAISSVLSGTRYIYIDDKKGGTIIFSYEIALREILAHRGSAMWLDIGKSILNKNFVK